MKLDLDRGIVSMIVAALNTDGKDSSATIARLLQHRLDLDPAPVIVPARYAQGMLAARCPGVDGYKSRAARLAEHLNARYSNRERAYILSRTKANKLVALFETDRDACAITGKLREI